MIYVYHGEDTFNSRKRLGEVLGKYPRVEYFDSSEITPEILVQQGSSLFNSQQKKAVVIDNFSSLVKKRQESIIDILKRLENDFDCFIWEDKKLSANQLSKLAASKNVFLFKLPTFLFKFLDSFGEKNLPKNQLLFLQKTLETHPPELILYLLIGRLKELLLAKIAPDNLKKAPWQKNNLIRQAKGQNLEKIKQVYSKLIELEWKSKTGQTKGSLNNELINLLILN